MTYRTDGSRFIEQQLPLLPTQGEAIWSNLVLHADYTRGMLSWWVTTASERQTECVAFQSPDEVPMRELPAVLQTILIAFRHELERHVDPFA